MKTFLTIILGLHGLLHLVGFVKAFNLAEVKELSQPVSKLLGLGWGLTFLLFLAAAVFLFRNNYWWLITMVAVGFSQLLVIISIN